MCKNCKNNSNDKETPMKWYFSATRNVDYRECPLCFQIVEEKGHEHIISEKWIYQKENNLDVRKCSICSCILEIRPHINGFNEEKNAFLEWCCNDYQESNVDTEEKFLANEETY